MSNSLHDSRYSIDHAKRRLNELEAEIAAFFETHPYANVVEHDVNRSEDVHKVKLIKAVPVALPGIAFDTLNNMRAALDQAGYAIAVAAGTKGKAAKFPFGDNETEARSRINFQSKDIPPEIFDVMISLQPYKGGNDLLWAVNKACNTNKHKIVVPVAHVAGNRVSLDGILSGRIRSARWPPTWDSTKHEMEIARVPHGDAFQINLKFSTGITFGEVAGVAGKPLTGVLRAMLGEVERSVMAVEAEARRLGLLS